MQPSIRRREFLIACSASGVRMASALAAFAQVEFELSLVESSLTRSFAEKAFEHLDFARLAASEFGIQAIEYGAEFFPTPRPDDKLLGEMNKRAGEHGVRQLLIRVGQDVRIGEVDAAKRKQAIQAVRQWIDVAKELACHSVEVNAASSGSEDEQQKRAAAALAELCEHAAARNINVLIGNYGGVAAKAVWVESVIHKVGAACCRALPKIRKLTADEDYQNLARLIPHAKGVTAETLQFDEQGNETSMNYARAMQTVRRTGYRGYVGIHYRGAALDEAAGIRATKALLDRLRSATE